MKTHSSKNTEVQTFLDDLLKDNSQQHEILWKARELVFDADESVTEEIKYSGVYFSKNEEAFGWIFPYSEHVSFEFSNGASFKDDEKILEWRGKARKHIKLKYLSDIKEKNVENFIKQALKQ